MSISIPQRVVYGVGSAVPAPFGTAFPKQTQPSQPIDASITQIIGDGTSVPATMCVRTGIDAICLRLLDVHAPASLINAVRGALIAFVHTSSSPNATHIDIVPTHAGQWLLAHRAEVQA
jgi:hypothetical protein